VRASRRNYRVYVEFVSPHPPLGGSCDRRSGSSAPSPWWDFADAALQSDWRDALTTRQLEVAPRISPPAPPVVCHHLRDAESRRHQFVSQERRLAPAEGWGITFGVGASSPSQVDMLISTMKMVHSAGPPRDHSLATNFLARRGWSTRPHAAVGTSGWCAATPGTSGTLHPSYQPPRRTSRALP